MSSWLKLEDMCSCYNSLLIWCQMVGLLWKMIGKAVGERGQGLEQDTNSAFSRRDTKTTNIVRIASLYVEN